MDLRPPLWREQLGEIHHSQRDAAYKSLEQHLVDDAGIAPNSRELLLARIAVGNFTVKGAYDVEIQGKPVDIFEAAKFKGIELSPARAKAVSEALAATLPRVVRVWGKERSFDGAAPSVDGLGTYLNNPDFQHTYLDEEEEQRLLRISEQGRALADIQHPTLSQQEILRAAKEARGELVLHNLKFAVRVANRYRNSDSDMEDLIQVANEGLIKAAQNARPGMGARFITYAGKCIENEIKRYFENGRSGVRIKSEHYETVRYIKDEHVLADRLGRRPTPQEMVDHDPAKELSLERVERLRHNAALLNQVSMPEDWKDEHPHEEIDPDHLSHNILMPTHRHIEEDDVFDQVQSEMLIEQLELVLDTLSDREAGVVRMRFGLNEKELQMTLDEIAKVYGVTRERIRQIESKSMSKLRHPSRSDSLKDYL